MSVSRETVGASAPVFFAKPYLGVGLLQCLWGYGGDPHAKPLWLVSIYASIVVRAIRARVY